MKKIKAVIGLGYGDEGKGKVVDYLCSQDPDNSLVVRFNGGHQAGHTVVYDEHRHVFSNFGSGTFRRVPTYWSKYCTVDPVGLINELNKLHEMGINPVLFIDGECPITTPIEKRRNHQNEDTYSHGSVGVGFGKTIEREEKFHYHLLMEDLLYPRIFQKKLDLIRTAFMLDEITQEFLHAVDCIIHSTEIVIVNGIDSCSAGVDNIIFEGAQGLMLDQNFGFFPNVTRSNTGIKNIEEMGFSIDEVYYVTRAYQTRHGNGHMNYENTSEKIKHDPMETNVYNEWQGELRRATLDLETIKYAMHKDKFSGPIANLVINCMDHLEEFSLMDFGQRRSFENGKSFIEYISDSLGIDKRDIYISYGPEADDIMRWK